MTLNGISQFNSVITISKSLKSDYLYVFNYNVDRFYDDYEGDSIYYKWDYAEIDGEYKKVIYTTKDGIKNGIPYLYSSILFFGEYNEDLHYDEFIKLDNSKYVVDNYFFKYNLDAEYIYIYGSDNALDSKNSHLVVYDYVINGKPTFNTNMLGSDYICCSGDGLQNQIISSVEIQSHLLLMISCVSIIVCSIAIYFLLIYFLDREKDVILINHIYYYSKKNLINRYRLMLTLSLFVINMVVNLGVYFICGVIGMYTFMYIIGIVYTIIEYVVIHFTVKFKIKHYLKENEWRYYDDTY